MQSVHHTDRTRAVGFASDTQGFGYVPQKMENAGLYLTTASCFTRWWDQHQVKLLSLDREMFWWLEGRKMVTSSILRM